MPWEQLRRLGSSLSKRDLVNRTNAISFLMQLDITIEKTGLLAQICFQPTLDNCLEVYEMPLREA